MLAVLGAIHFRRVTHKTMIQKQCCREEELLKVIDYSDLLEEEHRLRYRPCARHFQEVFPNTARP